MPALHCRSPSRSRARCIERRTHRNRECIEGSDAEPPPDKVMIMLPSATKRRTTLEGSTAAHFTFFVFLVLISCSRLIVSSAWANEPAAIVEHVTNGPLGLEAFDYLSPGRVIELEERSALTIIYFQSCARETILGGQITIGEERSHIVGSAQFRRISMRCGGETSTPQRKRPSNQRGNGFSWPTSRTSRR